MKFVESIVTVASWRRSLMIVLVATACLPPAAAPKRDIAGIPLNMRVTYHGSRERRGGVLIHLTEDSVRWLEPRRAGADSTANMLRTDALSRFAHVERVEVLSQRDALKRGLWRGALVGGIIGGAMYAISPQTLGGAVLIAAGSAWVGGVTLAQQTESPQPPVRWRTVYRSDSAAAVNIES